VSSYSPVGYIVTKIRAHDSDIGSNALLVYSVTSHDDVTPLPFDVDASNGAVYVTSSLRGRSSGSDVDGTPPARRNYVLSVSVRDRGSPSLSARASLVVHVNDSRSFAVAQSLLQASAVGARGQFGFNQQILVVVAAVTSIVAMLLVAAIVFVRRRHLQGWSSEGGGSLRGERVGTPFPLLKCSRTHCQNALYCRILHMQSHNFLSGVMPPGSLQREGATRTRSRGCMRPGAQLGPRHQFSPGSSAFPLFLFYETTTVGVHLFIFS